MPCTLGLLNLHPLISKGPRLIAQIGLLVVFSYFFGLPAIERFLKKDVMVVETLKKTDGIPSPAITISVTNQIKDHTCFVRNESIEECLVKACLKQSDIIKNVKIGSKLQKEVKLTQKIIREDFTSDWPGIYFTLNLPINIGTNAGSDMILIGINRDLSYLVFIHDPEYFLLNDNPTVIPGAIRGIDTNEAEPHSWRYRLEVTEVNKLNRPASPCNDDLTYSFLSCVRKSVASKVQ